MEDSELLSNCFFLPSCRFHNPLTQNHFLAYTENMDFKYVQRKLPNDWCLGAV